MIYNLLETYEPYVPPTWAGGTDAEIVEALEKHYAGKIDLTEYWSVGDEREVSLSAIPARTGLSDSQPAQNVTFVIMNVGGKKFTSDDTECAFIVGQKNVLSVSGEIAASADEDYWRDSVRRAWCNADYYNAIPSTLRPIFKQFKNIWGIPAYGGQYLNSDNDYFALPAEMEVFGDLGNSKYASNTLYENANLKQFEYYKTAANRKKLRNIGGNLTQQCAWWLRSHCNTDNYDNCFCSVSGEGNPYLNYYTYTRYLVPFGCI